MKKEDVVGLVTKLKPSLTPSGLSRPLLGMLRKSPVPPSMAPPTSEVREATRMRAARAAAPASGTGCNISVRREMCPPPHFELH